MALTILSTTPAQNATGVKLGQGEIEIAFSQKMNRELTESGLSVRIPADVTTQPECFTKWEQRTRVVNGANVQYDVVRVRIGILLADCPYELTVDATKAKSVTNEGLAANFVLKFRSQALDLTLPLATAQGGDSRNVVPPSGYKRAIVLSGGGAKGSFQVGVLKYLYNTEGFYPDLLVGTSVGAVNAAKLAEATTVAEHKATVTALENLWKSIRLDSDIYEPTPAFDALERKWTGSGGGFDLSAFETFVASLPFAGLVVLDEIEDKIENYMVRVDEVRKSRGLYSLNPLKQNWLSAPKLDAGKVFGSKVDLQLGAVKLNSGTAEWFKKAAMGGNAETLKQSVLASAAMPGIFEAIDVNGALYTDGGVAEVAGLAQALKSGATDIVVIPTYPRGGFKGQPSFGNKRYSTLETILSRALTEIVFDEMLRNDIDGVIKEQEWIARLAGQNVRIRVVEPRLEMHTSLNFHPEAIERNIQHGYDVARQQLGGAAPIIPPHPQEQTRSSFYLVVNPKWPNGTELSDHRRMYDYTGGLSEPLETGGYKDVRIIIREGGKIVNTYPGDATFEYPQVIVPGSDPSLPDNLNPYLKGRRPGQAYAFPLHAGYQMGFVTTPGTPNHRPTNLEVEVIYSTVDGTTYKESRSKTNVSFVPDATGVMVHNVTMPTAAPAGGKSRRVMLVPKRIHGKVQNPPVFGILGAGEIPDLMALIGTDGLLAKGRWAATREVRHLPELKAARLLADDVKVTVFSLPNFQGTSKVMTDDGTYDIPFAVRSVKVQFD